jgi:hypothetical protein
MEHSAGKAPFPLLDLGVGSGFPHGFTGDDNGMVGWPEELGQNAHHMHLGTGWIGQGP